MTKVGGGLPSYDWSTYLTLVELSVFTDQSHKCVLQQWCVTVTLVCPAGLGFSPNGRQSES